MSLNSVRVAVVSLVVVLFGILVGATADCRAEEPLELLRQDAELADVFFVNPRVGWAVGDRGAIWHTDDAGRSWRLQKSPVRCRLNSVFFLDDKHGWAAGGDTQAALHLARGTVL